MQKYTKNYITQEEDIKLMSRIVTFARLIRKHFNK